MSFKALIPVRAGSQRVKNKNIRPFANTNLLELKIKQLKQVEGVDEICVSSDSKQMLEAAASAGATAILRDSKYATSEIPMNDVYEHLALNVDCEHILYTNVTSPLIEINTYQKCIEKYFSLKGYDSLNTVTLIKENLWLDDKPINYDPDNHPRSQDLPDIYALNFAVNIISRDAMISRRNIVGKKFYPYFIGKVESIDIDDEEDFAIAEIIYKMKAANNGRN